jgi:hypothetical protein
MANKKEKENEAKYYQKKIKARLEALSDRCKHFGPPKQIIKLRIMKP